MWNLDSQKNERKDDRGIWAMTLEEFTASKLEEKNVK